MQIFGLRSPLISLIIYKKCLKQLISQKVHALTRIAPYMATPKRNLLMNPFFISQFSYCYLVWMCHSRLMKNKINDYMRNAFALFTTVRYTTRLHSLKSY